MTDNKDLEEFSIVKSNGQDERIIFAKNQQEAINKYAKLVKIRNGEYLVIGSWEEDEKNIH